MKNANPRIRKGSMLVSSSQWTFDKQLEQKNVDPSVIKLCTGFPVYRLKEITKDDWAIEKANGRK